MNSCDFASLAVNTLISLAVSRIAPVSSGQRVLAVARQRQAQTRCWRSDTAGDQVKVAGRRDHSFRSALGSDAPRGACVTHHRLHISA
jgi:hypothetical protein